MEIKFSHTATRELERLEKSAQIRILEKLEFYSLQADAFRFAEKLTDNQDGDWRFRIGEYRVIFDVSNKIVFVHRIGHRKDIYH